MVPRTANAAVTQPGADGMSTNVLAIRVKNDSVEFVVNNTVVHTASKTELGTSTDGIVGLRVNHRLEVQIDGFAITRP